MSLRQAYGRGLATVTLPAGLVLAVWYPSPQLGASPAAAEASSGARNGSPQLPPELEDQARRVATRHLTTVIDLDQAPTDAADAYLRLHLLSHRLAEPNTINLDGLFTVLPNVVWTNLGPCSPDEFEQVRAALMACGRGPLEVKGVDKFPAMLDFVVPSGVRIADAARVRLGAHLAPGTTVMHEGFCNFNAGTLGTSMIEGRIAQGVVIEDGADIGGGASIMGTLSGGGQERVRVGARSLLGANAGLGIALGSDCVVEAGLYITAGTKVNLVGWPDQPDGSVVKARQLSGQSNILFRRNSLTGAVEALPRAGQGIVLNTALHIN